MNDAINRQKKGILQTGAGLLTGNLPLGYKGVKNLTDEGNVWAGRSGNTNQSPSNRSQEYADKREAFSQASRAQPNTATTQPIGSPQPVNNANTTGNFLGELGTPMGSVVSKLLGDNTANAPVEKDSISPIDLGGDYSVGGGYSSGSWGANDLDNLLKKKLMSRLDRDNLGISDEAMSEREAQIQGRLNEQLAEQVQNRFNNLNSRGVLPSGITADSLSRVSGQFGDALSNAMGDLSWQNEQMKANQLNNALSQALGYSQNAWNRDFQGDQFDWNRNFQENQFDWQRDQSAWDRGFQSDQFDWNKSFQENQLDWEKALKNRQLDMQEGQWQDQLNMNEADREANETTGWDAVMGIGGSLLGGEAGGAIMDRVLNYFF